MSVDKHLDPKISKEVKVCLRSKKILRKTTDSSTRKS